jgi:hypothetical protein
MQRADGPVSVADHVLEEAHDDRLVRIELVGRHAFHRQDLSAQALREVVFVLEKEAGARRHDLARGAVDVGEKRQSRVQRHWRDQRLHLVDRVLVEDVLLELVAVPAMRDELGSPLVLEQGPLGLALGYAQP